MPKDFKQPKPIQEGLRLMNQCPVCKGDYRADQKNILEQKNEAHLVHITCPHCSNSIVAVIVTTPVGLSSVGMLTDLTAEDVSRLSHRGPMNEDELFASHLLLKERNLSEILSERK
ncbi:MAG: hypothetical protein A2921_00050 [Candidatus Magasanikbacteria bacterium RIFCSPLOWO2_01_FULL_43_20b]|uniref:Uncharacterized protein n=1 Tax=Candidatus Magasanikbacteria bacterium RIFCSPLOWO2_12_FULL_43_12 TaxID=1798692 RepID=A0A1F6MTS1_9BACT|nr:MAG: hypothetical protein A3C74_00935 [Candidatus Magasanikbacteria bacterium RIFCSPHIGHO2_02_FULL_44_13]OGH72659.1 MAG: hypothetical protein A3I93_02330 [Candidatus Magasanikbacteria bacterium RIFCSPLOWO2_02_FULL_43_22]OGH72958.1 MAG: hypothetical protein A2921_00050 [Candidatus Magasanikbacteria bacterium RIFCSPLOWO2_01_FULL_43_20b]OGH75012.1 MAG: hypothetical protein A3G00_01515 [Candidatus Magasanikbacteria bacterium RIFCSPLOWO2_12_FULL_43_12]